MVLGLFSLLLMPLLLLSAKNVTTVSATTFNESSIINTTKLDCHMRQLAFQYAKSVLQPWWNEDADSGTGQSLNYLGRRKQQQQQQLVLVNIHDALRLTEWCNVPLQLEAVVSSATTSGDNDNEYEAHQQQLPTLPCVKTSRRRRRHLNDRLPLPADIDATLCASANVRCIFVVPKDSNNNNKKEALLQLNAAVAAADGSIDNPLSSLHQAIQLARHWKLRFLRDNSNNNNKYHRTKTAWQCPWTTRVILRQGIHSLGRRGTLRLGPDDSNLEIIGHPNEEVWISGGISFLGPPVGSSSARTADNSVEWKPWRHNPQIWVANLTQFLSKQSPTTSTIIRTTKDGEDEQNNSHIHLQLPKLISLFTTDPHHRLVRARYPNGNPELVQWGYASPDRTKHSIPTANVVLEWTKPAPGNPPNFTFVDLRTATSSHNNNYKSSLYPAKNDSTQTKYNMYASGHGGVCANVWGNEADSYWCSNASSGGWAFVDRHAAIRGRLQIPVGLRYNASHADYGSRIRFWLQPRRRRHGKCNSSRVAIAAAVGGIVHAWHSQSWAMHMFEIERMDREQMYFGKGGGNQGGRNWCRCDECTYAGSPWCGQYQRSNSTDDRLIGGDWMVENILTELDSPGEFYMDRNERLLYLMPNATTATLHNNNKSNTNNDLLQIALLERLIELRGVSNVILFNIGFRDTAPTYMGEWSAPSGGDWAMHRGGAIFMEDVDEITIRSCTFRRLDGNAIFLSRRTRNVTIEGSIFEWLGESAIATWGHTDGLDATAGQHPRHTVIQYNVMRELGIYQKQSSAFGQAKASESIIRNNVMFNMPRAAINFNDMMGGGDVVTRNAIFNTCRESGDHGPINTWDRQPFLTTLRDGTTASFAPSRREVSHNFIFANYGASQGVDNDDGSSWFHIYWNVFYSAEGFKMDYGGHDSIYEDNLVMAYPYDGQQCVNFGTFLPGHGHVVRRNKCIVGLEPPNRGENNKVEFEFRRTEQQQFQESPESELVVILARCKDCNALLTSNRYFTPNGTALFRCYDQNADYRLEDFQKRNGLEMGSTCETTPNEDTMLEWALSILYGGKNWPNYREDVGGGQVVPLLSA